MSGNTISNSAKEETFSGLEVRNKSGNSQPNNGSKNGFTFIKAKSTNEEQAPQSNLVNNNELLSIFENKDTKNQVGLSQKADYNNGKGGFSFIKNNKPSTQSSKDDLTNVFQDLNIVSKGESVQKSDNISKSIIICK